MSDLTGEYHFEVYNSKLKYDVEVTRNISVILGNGATGKTTLCRMISNAAKRGSGVYLHSTKNASVTLLTNEMFTDNYIQRHMNEERIYC